MDQEERTRARAEAKRKRILDSAENRLGKLRNLEIEDNDDAASARVVSEKVGSGKPAYHGRLLGENVDVDAPAAVQRNLAPQLVDPDRKTRGSIEAEKHCQLLHKYCDINGVALGICIRFIFATSIVPTLLQNAVIPFLLSEVAIIYAFRIGLEYTSSAGHLLSTALIMSGLSGEQLELLKIVINVCQCMLDDFILFAASFILTHFLLQLGT